MNEQTITTGTGFALPETKHRLAFHKDGSFRILMLSDVQEHFPYDETVTEFFNAVLDRERPDLILFGGDNCSGPHIRTQEEFNGFLARLTAPAEEHKIPWAHVFGNHDHDLFMDDGLQQQKYESCPYCVSSHTTGIHGTTNFVLPVYSHTGDDIRFAVWGLDTNNLATDMDGLLPGGLSMKPLTFLPKRETPSGAWDTVRFDQLMWYWNTSLALESSQGRKVPGLMIMHVAPEEFQIAGDHPEVSGATGVWEERLSPAVLNSGLFSAVVQRGDIRCISCGHTHKNDGEAELCGIRLCYDGSAGTRCYGKEETRGCRVFELSESQPEKILTRMVYKSEFGM